MDSLQTENRTAMWFSSTIPEDITEGMSVYNKVTCTPMLTATLFTIVKLWKQPRCPTTDKRIKQMCYLYIMEFYLAIKNDILSFLGKWAELKNIFFIIFIIFINFLLFNVGVHCDIYKSSYHISNYHTSIHPLHHSPSSSPPSHS
jgi:hypothetical protein